MRILQVINIGYLAGGAESSVFSIRDELNRRGHIVRVLSSDFPGGKMLSDYQIERIPMASIFKALHHIFYWRSYLTMLRIIKDFRPDIIHFHTVAAFSPSIFLAIGNIPAVMTVHGPEEFTLRLLPWFLPVQDYNDTGEPFDLKNLNVVGRFRYWYYCFIQRPLYRLLMRRIRYFIAPSAFLAEALRDDVPPAKIRQLYNGIDLPPTMPLPHSRGILYMGRLEKVKGVDYLIRAFARVVDKDPRVELSIVGDGSERARLESLTKELGLSDNVAYSGWLSSREEIAEEYGKSSVVVIPSIWPENLPTVCIEAFAAGRPVIGTRAGGIPELVEDGKTGYVVPIKNAAAISEAILTILQDEETLARMSREARMKALDFDMHHFLDQLEALYKEASL